jgi:hypothetical protein
MDNSNVLLYLFVNSASVVNAHKVPTYLTKFLKIMSYLGPPWSHDFLTMAWGRGFWIILLNGTRRCEAKHNHIMSVLKVCGIANGLELAGEHVHACISWKLGLYGPSWEQWSLCFQSSLPHANDKACMAPDESVICVFWMHVPAHTGLWNGENVSMPM